MLRKVLSLAAVGCLMAVTASAQNRVQNPNFDTDISGWTTVDGDVIVNSWNSDDLDGSGTSGSISSVNTDSEPNLARRAASQCVPAEGGETYFSGGGIRIPNTSSIISQSQITVVWHSDTACNSEPVGVTFTTFWRDEGAWFSDYIEITAPEGTQSATIGLDQRKNPPEEVYEVHFDSVVFQPVSGSGPCVPTGENLCLRDNRFKLTAHWVRPNGQEGEGTAVQLTSDTGYFWFFNAANVEMVVKVLRGCNNNNRYWVFAGGLTNVAVELRVEDTLTSEVQVYTNPISTPFQPIQDTSAFATCP